MKKPISDNIFVDTNLLVYLYSYDEFDKRGTVENLLDYRHYRVTMSTQVINEFINVMRKKKSVITDDLLNIIEEFYGCFQIARVRLRTVRTAIKIADKYKYSYYDSLLIASALEKKCTTLFSEDMQDGQVIEGRSRNIHFYRGVIGRGSA